MIDLLELKRNSVAWTGVQYGSWEKDVCFLHSPIIYFCPDKMHCQHICVICHFKQLVGLLNFALET